MEHYDVIVVGSGAGGLTAAVALAQAGQRVLVLEQHYVPGGWCHSFQLGGYRFSPGVHYIGELGPEGRMRRIYEGLGVSRDITFLELNPDGYDHVLIGSEKFDIPKGRDRFVDRLKSRFPHETRGIDKYIGTVERIRSQLSKMLTVSSVTDLIGLPFTAPTVLRNSFSTLQDLLDRCVSDPLLRAVLSAQCGDHGLPPSQAPAVMHASVAAHYFDGGYYPKGGAYTIPRAFCRALKRAGGEIRLRTSVEKILVENRRAVGVRLQDGSELRASHVISNADPGLTFSRLVGREHLSRRLRRRLSRTKYSVSALSLFMATDLDLAGMGYDSGNYWYLDEPKVDEYYRAMQSVDSIEMPELPGLFLTVTTLKDRAKETSGHHTMEAFWFVPYECFERWAASDAASRPDAYLQLKQTLTDRMLRTAEKIIPGLSDHLVFCELGTPLTNDHYIPATQGNIYGTEKSMWQIGPWSYPVRTELGGLLLCGASTVSHGVMGATLSGLIAAREVLGCRVRDLLSQEGPELRIMPCDLPAGELVAADV